MIDLNRRAFNEANIYQAYNPNNVYLLMIAIKHDIIRVINLNS